MDAEKRNQLEVSLRRARSAHVRACEDVAHHSNLARRYADEAAHYESEIERLRAELGEISENDVR